VAVLSHGGFVVEGFVGHSNQCPVFSPWRLLADEEGVVGVFVA